ncbi:hypothetical protein TNCT_577561 [Trichonephila clavata]|uniref:Uncharacterized protein n=1 Tax=Trichonephila clavata TaxID=2740835 RepID=A0A8X6JFS0_TRICU|nr:hypothetical protein TNCT_577561 [Trichonephila clavata]
MNLALNGGTARVHLQQHYHSKLWIDLVKTLFAGPGVTRCCITCTTEVLFSPVLQGWINFWSMTNCWRIAGILDLQNKFLSCLR